MPLRRTGGWPPRAGRPGHCPSVVQRDDGGGYRQRHLAGCLHHRGPEGEELDGVAATLVGLLLEPHADDARGTELVGLVLHPGHGQLAGLVQCLGEVGELYVLPGRAERLPDSPVGDVVDAGPHDQALGNVTGLHQRPEVLAREVRGEGLAELVAMGDTVLRLDRGADSDELGGILAPFVVVDVEPHADDAVGTELGGLFLHAGHGQLPRVVHGLGQLGELLALPPLPGLDAGVVDRGAHHEPQWVESHLLDQQELVDRKVRGEQAVLELFEPAARPFGKVRRGVGHELPPITMFSSAWRTAWLCAASALRAASSRASHWSVPTFALRIRMPPDEWPMVHRRVAPSISASNWSSSMVILIERTSSDFLKSPPDRCTASREPRASPSWSARTFTRMRTSARSARSDAAANSRSKESSVPLTLRTLPPRVGAFRAQPGTAGAMRAHGRGRRLSAGPR